ncbi:DUF192 domain-containing protein [Ponticoccus gilvus]|nr:DUF192 domain-containing protein [Enemella evansiae]
MGNRLVALSSVLCLGLATALYAADNGSESLPVPPEPAEAPGVEAQDPAAGQAAEATDPAPEVPDDPEESAAGDSGAAAADLAATEPAAVGDAADDAPSTGDALAASDLPSSAPEGEDPAAAPAEDMIIAPIGDEVLDAPEGDATLLAGDFPPVDPTAPACREDTILLRGDFGKARFSVEVADDGPKRAQGLMHVKSMPPSFGMLFVYPSARPVSFWMKNTLIPLDMIFADQHGVVQRVHAMAQPRDLTPIPGGDNIQYVLEINGGMANMLGIKPGSQMRHPAISDPAWRCN